MPPRPKSYYLRIICALIISFSGLSGYAQLCSGSLGDPVINITFGAGTGTGAPLNTRLTNYTFFSNDCPSDGSYTIRNSSGGCFGSSWHILSGDHTGDPNGYFMLVNASYSPSDFYLEKVSGLCPNTTYEFAAWLLNIMNREGSIKPNITFSIEKTDGTLLRSINTGDLNVYSSPKWEQFGFFFTTPADVTTVVIRIRNNAPGGNGNDLSLDDITFRPCGPKVDASIFSSGSGHIETCEGDTSMVKFSAEISDGFDNPEYQWQVSENGGEWIDIANATEMSLQFKMPETGNFQYRLSVANSGNMGSPNCRIASNILKIDVNENPRISLEETGEQCVDGQLQVEAGLDLKYPDNWSGTWTGPPGGTPFSTTINVNPGSSIGDARLRIASLSFEDSGYYKIEVVNGKKCSARDSVYIRVLPRPLISFPALPNLCAFSGINLKANATIPSPLTISEWSWTLPGGDISNQPEPEITLSGAGNYSASLSTVASNGCSSDTAILQLVVHPLPEVNFGLPEVCLADPFAQFSDSSEIADGTASNFRYSWFFDDPLANSSNPNTSVEKSPKHKFNSTGVYNVKLQVSSLYGCQSELIKPFTVNGSVPKALFSITEDAVYCSDQDLVLKNISTVDFGSITRVEIYWNYDRDPFSKTVDEEPFTGKEYFYRYANSVVNDQQDFRIRYIAYSGINCVSESDRVITVHKSPEVEFSPLPAVCENVPPFQLTGFIELTGLGGQGILSGNGISGDGLFNPANAGDGNHSVQFLYTTTAGCKDTISRDLLVYPRPELNAGPDRTLISGGIITLDVNAEGEGLQFSWTPDLYISNSTIEDPQVFPPVETLYRVNAISSDGCETSDEVVVKVMERMAVPNAFTPNGDGRNDTWRVPYLESFPDFELKIFNRYGQVVYQARNQEVNWDGRLNGKELPSGSYAYTIDIKKYGPPLHGLIHLIR